jgi:hypothetical protein
VISYLFAVPPRLLSRDCDAWLGAVCVLLGEIHVLAYNDVRDNKKPTTWLLLDYVSEKSDKLILAGTGDGGLTELKESGLLKRDAASFAYVRVVGLLL